MTSKEIKEVFFDLAATAPTHEVAYRDLWANLVDRGWAVRGATPKRQQDAVYSALKSEPLIVKVRPGVFAPKT